MYPPKLYSGPTIQSRSAARRAAQDLVVKNNPKILLYHLKAGISKFYESRGCSIALRNYFSTFLRHPVHTKSREWEGNETISLKFGNMYGWFLFMAIVGYNIYHVDILLFNG